MHGTGDMTQWRPIESRQTQFLRNMKAISLPDHERADDEKLAALAARIREA
jgi:hypothetical protein